MTTSHSKYSVYKTDKDLFSKIFLKIFLAKYLKWMNGTVDYNKVINKNDEESLLFFF